MSAIGVLISTSAFAVYCSAINQTMAHRGSQTLAGPCALVRLSLERHVARAKFRPYENEGLRVRGGSSGAKLPGWSPGSPTAGAALGFVAACQTIKTGD